MNKKKLNTDENEQIPDHGTRTSHLERDEAITLKHKVHLKQF